MASRNADLCMDCRIVYFENNTHWVVDEEPDAINQLILGHIIR
jgi:pimeloyl-ACP methyl ester carboxylesterase